MRSASGSREPADDFAPPSELVLPQLCLAVGAKELISRLSRTGRKRVEAGEEGGSEETGGGEVGAKQGVPGKKEAGGLFREREPLSFFAVDCRPKEQVRFLADRCSEATVFHYYGHIVRDRSVLKGDLASMRSIPGRRGC